MSTLADLLARHRGRAALAGLLLVVAASLLVRPVAIEGSLDGFDIPGNPYEETAQRIETTFDIRPSVQVEVTPRDTTLGAVIEDLELLRTRIREVVPDGELRSLQSLAPFLPSLGLKSDTPVRDALASIDRTSLGKGLVSRDGRSFRALIEVPVGYSGDPAKADEILGEPYPALDTLRIFSLSHLQRDIVSAIRSDSRRLIALTIVLAAACLLWAFRSWRSLVFVALLTGSAVVGASATLSTLAYRINIATMLTIPTVIVVSLADSVHLLNGWAASPPGETPQHRLRFTIARYFFPSLLTTLTTAAAFFSLLTSDAANLRQLGASAGIGVLLAFPPVYLLGPFLLVVLGTEPRRSGTLEAALRVCSTRAKPIGISLLAILPLALVLAPRLKLGTPPDHFFPRGARITRTYETMTADFYALASIDIIVEPADSASGRLDGAGMMDLTKEIADRIAALPGVALVLSANDVIAQARASGASLPVLMELLRHNPYLSADGRTHRLQVRATNGDIVPQVARTIEAEALRPYQGSVRWAMTSPILAMDFVNAHVVRGLLTSFLVSMGVTLLLVAILVRSVRAMLVTLAANIVPLGLAVCLFGALGLQISVLTAAVVVVSLGLIVDDTLHALFRLETTRGQLEELPYSMATTSLLLSLGFLVFVSSSFGPVRTLGGVLSAVLVVALLADLTLLPWLLAPRQPRGGWG